MKLVILEKISLGTDLDISFYKDFGETTYYENTTPEEVAQRVADADIIIANKAPLNEATLGEAKHLKLICETATGYNNVDLDYCKAHGIRVTNVVGYSTPIVAQHTFAMALYLLEKLPVYDTYVKNGNYANCPIFTCFEPFFAELEGKVWGIIGLGNIGRKVAEIANVFGCRVIYYSASGNNTSTEYERVDFDILLAESDILSLHCPLTDRTQNIINADALAKMKKTAILINVARGPVVDEQALYDALENGTIAAAGLDVLVKEPIAADNPLGKIKDSTKLLITPHMAWGSHEARERCAKEVYQNIESFLNGKERNIVV
ncbi:MAG: D-2-hydroxyacid dehydrogenase [Lachnospiraceae bacterium]|nr:D-2-hydroxyacid dehydrogenase [Lachnospiraceae bacterium]